MARLTNEHLHSDLKLVKQDLEYVKENQERIREDLSMIKKKLLNPYDGAVTKVNQNTAFRRNAQKTLWSIWIALIGIITKMIFWD
tara:strand:- start:1972 stop:2226 length:255 start_codon:yes stop_codon:yes gene_type:complete